MFMWRSVLPSYRRLMRAGAKADALVVKSRVTRGSAMACRLTLQVHFPDGSSVEVVRRVQERWTLYTRTVVGTIMPMRYDPADHRRIEVDYPTVQRLAAAERDELESQLREHGRHELSSRQPEAQQPAAHAPARGVSLLIAADQQAPAADGDDDSMLERLAELKRRYRAGTLDRDGVAAAIRTLKEEQFQHELTAFLDSPD